jgi:thiol-disulfide isomerase/thioredoxin
LELYDELFYVDAINYYLKEGNLKEANNYFTKLNTYINQLKGTLNAKDLFHQILMNDIFKKPDDSKVYVEELKRRCDYPSFGNPNYYMAKYYCHCDSIENAFKYLERAYKNHEADLIWLKVDEDLFVLHDDPRYSELYTKIGFKAYDEYIEKEGIAFSTLQ